MDPSVLAYIEQGIKKVNQLSVKSSLCSGNAHSYNFIVNWFSGNNLPDC